MISFFENGTYVVGVDYTYIPATSDESEKGRPDCIGAFEVDFDPITQTVRLENGEIVIKDIPIPPESYEDIKMRVIQSLIHAQDPTTVDTEGVTGFDMDYLILARFFKGDRGREIGFTQRFSYLLSIAKKTPEEVQELEIIKAGYLAKEAYKNYISSL